ncbi:nitrogen regulation protein NR(II) [Alteromonas oceani]|uniref:Sensory histidine kinase/phosphatase NtrB n=1 Tax=Alteromonas oceani TaxID=2071609 RepID=A0ABV7K107_9ALTE|nr:nitrogen regulation protein NR(II) [Alteromonas oceani]
MHATPFDTNNLLENLNTVLVVIDNSLRIVYANHAGQALFATGIKQLYGQPLADFFVPNTINKARLRAAFRRGEDFTENEIKLYFRDNRVVLADLTVTNLSTEDGPTLLFEVKKIDQQKRISRENQQHAQHYAARELIRGLAHEIKNPLGGIRGAAQLLEKALESAEQKEFTQLIIEQSDRLRNLVDRLLGPNSLPRLEWCNLHRPLEKVRSLMKADTTQAIAITRDYDPSIPEVRVDPDMLQQAVLNIVRNAVQALRDSKTPNPQIRLVTRIERQLTIHGHRHPLAAQIKIIDNGPGIPSEIRDTLFYPLVTSKDSGSGLGLSIAQTLVNHHDGKIEVDSRPGHTEFILSLPIDRKESQ